MAIRVMSSDEVRGWLGGGGRIGRVREGAREYYRVVAEAPPHGGRLPEVPDAVVADLEQRGWLTSVEGGAVLELSPKGRDEMG